MWWGMTNECYESDFENRIFKSIIFLNASMLHATHVMYYAYMWLSASTKTSIALMFSSLLNTFSMFPPEISSLLLCGPVCLFHRKGRWFYCGPISCRLDTYKCINIRFPCGNAKVNFLLGCSFKWCVTVEVLNIFIIDLIFVFNNCLIIIIV